MDFTNQYLSYEEYMELGGTLEEVPFNELEYECRKIIDRKTLNRLKNIDTIPEEVKMCEYNMIQNLKGYIEMRANTQKGIQSENTDGYSVTYSSNNQINELINAKTNDMEQLVSTYLFGVIVNNEHILYCGV